MQQDELLIRRAQKGDADAFEMLMAPLEKRIYALCLRMAGNREDALDCSQEAMLRVWRAMHSYRARPPLRPGPFAWRPTPAWTCCAKRKTGLPFRWTR